MFKLSAVMFICFLLSDPAMAQTAQQGPLRIAEAARTSTVEAVRVQSRKSDSLLNGALIGAGVGIASGLALCTLTEPWENCRDDAGPIVRFGAIGAGVGMAIDALIRRRDTGHDPAGSARLIAAPGVGRKAGAVHVLFSF